MASINDLLSSALAGTSQQLTDANGLYPEQQIPVVDQNQFAGNDFYQIAAGQGNQAGASTMGEVETDLRTLNTSQLFQKYGAAASQLIDSAATGDRALRNDQALNSRTGSMIAGDTVSGIGGGFANSLAGLGALGLGLVNDNAGAWASKKIEEGNEWLQSTQSDTLNARRRATQAEAGLEMRDSNAQYERERTEDGEAIASLRRIGRDAWSTISVGASDSVTFGQGTSDAIGSLLAGGPIAKTLKAIGSVALKTAQVGGLSVNAAGKAAAVGESLAMPAAIGAMEAGGAYQQTVNEVNSMSFDELQANSQDFRDLIAQNVSPEDARTQLANSAGLTAAAIQAPIAAATGKLVARFEEAPFRVGSVRQSLLNTAIKEPLEEGIQSGTGGLAQNIAIRSNADDTRSLSEGVGEQVGEGALYGFSAAGTVQAPGTAVKLAQRTGQATMQGLMSLGGSLIERGNKVAAATEEASPISEAQILAATDAALAEAPATMDEVRADIDALDATPEAKEQAQTYVDNLINQLIVDPGEIEGAPENLRATVEGSTTRVEMVQKLANAVNTMEVTDDSFMEHAMALYGMVQAVNDFRRTEAEALDQLPGDARSKQELRKFEAVVTDMTQSPKVRRAFGVIEKMIAEANIQQVDESNVALAAAQAEVAPQNMSEGTINQVLEQNAAGTLNLTNDQLAAFNFAKQIVQETKRYTAEADRLGLKRPQDLVRKQVLTDGQHSGDDKKSLLQHAQGVLSAKRAGNDNLAGVLLKDLGDFAQHMQNKVVALNSHVSAGDPNAAGVTYSALQPDRTWKQSPKGVFVNTRSSNSIELAHQISLEAQSLANVFNSLSDSFPELNAGHVESISLDPSLNGPIQQVADSFRAAPRNVVSEPTEAASATVAEVAVDDTPAVSEQVTETSPVRDEPVTSEETSQVVEAPVVEETVAEETAPEPTGLAAVYPSLNQFGNTGNRFMQAYRLPTEAKTHTISEESPLGSVKDALSSSAKMTQRTNGAIRHDMTSDIVDAYADIISEVDGLVDVAKANMVKWLDAPYSKSNKTSRREIIEQNQEITTGTGNTFTGDQFASQPQGLALNLLKDDFTYNEQLLETAALASMQWMINADNYGQILDEDGLNSMIGADSSQLSSDMIDMLNQGMSTEEAKRSLASKINSYWGLEKNNNVSQTFTEGLSEAMAGEMLRALEEQGLLRIESVRLDQTHGLDEPRTFNRIIVESLNTESPIRDYPSAIEEAVMVTPENVSFMGDAMPPVAERQMNNPQVENTVDQIDALTKESKTVFGVNMPVVTLWNSLGRDGLTHLFGYVQREGQVFNKKHEQSVKGKNLSIVAAYDSLTNTIREATNLSGAMGIPVSELPIRFAYNMSRVGRMQMLGKHNPQANKIVREAILPTRSTLDLTNSDHTNIFMVAVAQHLGIKVHNQSVEKSIADVQEALDVKLSRYVDLINGYTLGEAADSADLAEMKKAFADAEIDLTPGSLHGIAEYARMEKAEGNSFTTSLYVEADGMTNGPINAMGLMTIGKFDENWLKNVRKGGISFGAPQSANDIRQFVDHKDLYQTATDGLALHMTKLRQELINDKFGTHQLNRLMSLMDLFNKDMSFDLDSGSLTFKRGIAKNPLTITIYGSGERGIAGNVTEALTTAIYQRMSDAATALAADDSLTLAQAMFGVDDLNADAKMNIFTSALGELTDATPYRVPNGPLKWGDGKQVKDRNGIDPETFEFTKPELDNIITNVQHLFVAPLRAGIQDTVGKPLFKAVTVLRQATQVQSIFYAKAMREAIVAEIAKTPERFFPSRAQVNKIIRDLAPLAPLIDTGDQRFLVAGSERLDIRGVEFGAALNGQFRTPAMSFFPSNAGVSGIPFMTIGPGDGLMMQILARMGLEGTLKIFDGMNMPLDKAIEYSRLANEAVNDTLKGNPLADVKKSYDVFIKAAANIEVTESMVPELARALFEGPQVQSAKVADIQKAMKELVGKLDFSARSIDARHAAEATLAKSVDHMAAVGAPYSNGVPVNEALTNDSLIVEALNAAYEAEMAKTKSATPEDAFIEGINPTAARLDSVDKGMADTARGVTHTDESIDMPPSAVKIKTVDGVDVYHDTTKLYPTEGMSGYSNQDMYYAVVDGETVGVYGKTGLEDVISYVKTPYRRKGISSTLVREFQKTSPNAKTSGLSEAGEAVRRKMFREQTTQSVTNSPEQIRSVGRQDRSGARVLSPTALRKLSRMVTMTSAQQVMFGEIMRADSMRDWKVVYGSPEQLMNYQMANGGLVETSGTANGYTVMGTKTIYLVNPSTETLVHEMVHAATFTQVLNHYEGNSTPEVSEAIGRIEVLMEQFLSEDSSDPAYQNARSAIIDGQSNLEQDESTGKAIALNEFMAWALTNNKLTEDLKAKQSPSLVQMAKNVIKAIKQMIWGRKKAPVQSDDALSALQFNTGIVIRSQPSLSVIKRDATLFQNANYGDKSRLAELGQLFASKISDFMATPIQQNTSTNQSVVSDATMNASRLAISAQAHGFPMTMQESAVFKDIHVALATLDQLDSTALAKVGEIYNHVTKTLKVEDFMPENSIDEQADRYYAQEQFNVIMGNYLTTEDSKGRSSLMPQFLALAMVNDHFRDVLAKMDLPTRDRADGRTVDGVLGNLGNDAMDSLSKIMSGQGRKTNKVGAALDNLMAKLYDQALDNATFIDQYASKPGGLIDRGNDYIVNGVEALSEKVAGKLANISQNTNNKIVRAAADWSKAVANFATEKNGAKVAEGVIATMNKGRFAKPLSDIMVDLVGRTSTNAKVYDMIKQVRSMVSQMRQQFREHLPGTIASKFKRKVTDTEWSVMHRALGKTDVAALRGSMKDAQIFELFTDQTKLTAAIQNAETTLQGVDAKLFSKYQSKSKQLAGYMMDGVVGNSLLRNAYAIANLFGERSSPTSVAQSTIDMIDQLVTLYAIDSLSPEAKKVMADLSTNEVEGLQFSMANLTGRRQDELAKTTTPRASANQYKGYIPALQQPGVQLIVAEDADFAKLAERSFTRVAHYGGSSLDGQYGSKSYYFAPVSGRAGYNQGILQNVRNTAMGVDAVTGFSMAMNAGRITERNEVARIAASLKREGQTDEPMMPIFNEIGKIVAFERAIDPQQLQRLNHDTNFARMMGVWTGRQVEEVMAQSVNESLIKELKNVYDADIKKDLGNEDQYINPFLSDDKVVQDAVNLWSPETKAFIDKTFPEGFRVRKDMFNDAFGYRQASVGDIWSGNSRWSPELIESTRKMVVGAFGNQAYRYFVNSEKVLQNFITDAKFTIVVRSIIVPVSNMISNVYQLAGRGVPLKDLIKGFGTKTAEIDSYVKSRLRLIDAEAELLAADGDIVKERKLKTEIQSINDQHRRLSIWPLIEAGEFTAISDVGRDADDIELTSGRLNSYLAKQVDKLPGSIRTAGRYAIITKDTALYQGLHKAIQYGDFVAKAVLFDELTKRKGRTAEYALGRVSEEFVNYDRLPGRFRGYVESIGLLWFWNFKIRSAKVGLSMLRNNPLHSMLAMAAPAPTMFGNVDVPIDANIFAKLADGSLDYSMGMGQAFRAPMLNPWVNLVN